jgi:hypothetical protein
MNTLPRFLGLAVVLAASAGFTSLGAQSPVRFPAASPNSTLRQQVGLTDIEVVYARPGVKNREIFGGLVAYDQVWRTGANAATKITFSTPVTFGDTRVEAGTYLLYSIPRRNADWTVILQRDGQAWGSSGYNADNDVARASARATKLNRPVETFTIDVNNLRDGSATLDLTWDRTRVSVPLKVDVVPTVMAQIQQAMAAEGQKSPGFLFQSANFYLEHGGDLEQANRWIAQAVEAQPNAFWVAHVQAKILAKLNRKNEAIAAAERSRELAIAAEGPHSGYVKQNNDLIASLR